MIFVPNTPGSELKKRYMKAIKNSDVKTVKVVEGTGRSIKNMLQRSDPTRSKECNPPPPVRDTEHNECPVCLSGNNRCRKEGVTYEIRCTECNDVYVGETADNAYHRGKQHADALRNHVPGSALYKHVRNTHPDGPSPAFKMKVTGVYGKDALLRQVTEGVQINAASERKKCMNSRSEWNHQAIPRITLMDD